MESWRRDGSRSSLAGWYEPVPPSGRIALRPALCYRPSSPAAGNNHGAQNFLPPNKTLTQESKLTHSQSMRCSSRTCKVDFPGRVRAWQAFRSKNARGVAGVLLGHCQQVLCDTGHHEFRPFSPPRQSCGHCDQLGGSLLRKWPISLGKEFLARASSGGWVKSSTLTPARPNSNPRGSVSGTGLHVGFNFSST